MNPSASNWTCCWASWQLPVFHKVFFLFRKGKQPQQQYGVWIWWGRDSWAPSQLLQWLRVRSWIQMEAEGIDWITYARKKKTFEYFEIFRCLFYSTPQLSKFSCMSWSPSSNSLKPAFLKLSRAFGFLGDRLLPIFPLEQMLVLKGCLLPVALPLAPPLVKEELKKPDSMGFLCLWASAQRRGGRPTLHWNPKAAGRKELPLPAEFLTSLIKEKTSYIAPKLMIFFMRERNCTYQERI